VTGLGPDLRERYRKEGYLFPLEARADTEIQACRERLLALAGDAGLPPDVRTNTHLQHTWAAQLVALPAVLDAVASLLGPDLLVWRASFFFKGAKDASFVAWHQDSVYWDLDGDEVATAWIALTDSTENSGCVRVVPGSHRAPALPHAVGPEKNNVLLRGQVITVPVDETTARPLLLRAGQFSLHHVGIVHGSQSNRSGDPRVGFAVRYVASHVKPCGARHTATLVRGEDRHGHFDLVPLPRFEGDPLAQAGHARAMRGMAKQALRQLRGQPLAVKLKTLLRLARRPGAGRAALRYLVRR
jgi:chlorinating enzyme